MGGATAKMLTTADLLPPVVTHFVLRFGFGLKCVHVGRHSGMCHVSKLLYEKH